MVVVTEETQTRESSGRIALYARVSSADQKADLIGQMERLHEYAEASGHIIAREVTEIASGLNDQRPKLMKLLEDTSITVIIIEHRDRLTRFGYHSIERLLNCQGRKLEVIFPSDTDNDLVDDMSRVLTSQAARIGLATKQEAPCREDKGVY